MAPFAPPAPPGAQPPPLWGAEDHLRELFGDRVRFGTLTREALEVTAFDRPGQLREHFETNYGPTLAALANARRNGTEDELRTVLRGFGEQRNRGTPERARFAFEYLLAIGTRA
jgi:hypothetical protein